MPSYIANYWIAFEIEADDEEEAAREAEERLREAIEADELAGLVSDEPDIIPN